MGAYATLVASSYKNDTAQTVAMLSKRFYKFSQRASSHVVRMVLRFQLRRMERCSGSHDLHG